MVYHRAQAQFDRARWNLRVLVPAWVVQLAVLLTLVGLFSYRLADTMSHYKELEEQGLVPVVEIVWECTNTGLSLLSVILTFVEVARLWSETLTPWTVLFSNIIKIVCAFAILALDIVVYLQRTDGHYSTIGLALDSIFIVAALVPGIYAIRTFRRLSVFDEYHYGYAVNAKPYGYGDLDDTEYNNGGGRKSNPRLSIGAISEHLDRRLSSTSTTRRESASAAAVSPLTPTGPPLRLEQIGRTASYYSHQRDTQFDDYVAARASLSLKSDIERAMAAEFGWSSSSPGAGKEDDLARRPSVIGAGTVASGRVDLVGRTPGSGSSPWDNGSRQLTAVPELLEEADEQDIGHGQPIDAPAGVGPDGHGDEDRQALLHGHERTYSQEGVIVMESEADLGQRKRKWTNG